jgi:hypothetical protein
MDIETPPSVAAERSAYDSYRPLCRLPGSVAWSADALATERARIAKLIAAEQRQRRRLPWELAALFIGGGLTAGALAVAFGVDVLWPDIAPTAPGFVGAVCSAGFRLLWLNMRPVPLETLENLRDALDPLSADRPLDGDLASVVGSLFEIDDPDGYDYRGRQAALLKMGRPITRLECLDLIELRHREAFAADVERRRAARRATIMSLACEHGVIAGCANGAERATARR